MDNPFIPFLNHQSTIILDGGLATELEKRGHDLNDTLWSAKILLERPEAIYKVHWDYLKAGADVLITASYQATIAGFMARGLSEAAAADLLLSSVRIAMQARDDFWADAHHRQNRLRPLVAASIGPYGAYLANGAEYTGAYDLDEQGLLEFHRRRWQLLAQSGADLLACETIPSFIEARAYTQLLPETPKITAWFSFSCRDGRHISDGTPLADCGRYLDQFPQVIGIGVNCTAPRFIPELITELQQVTEKPLVVYPNSGESYDALHNAWLGEAVAEEYGTSGREWRKLGAAAIGGCCRTRPSHILALSSRLKRIQSGDKRMTHILNVAEAVLYVQDLAVAREFYKQVLGLPVTAEFADACFLQTGPNSTLILFELEALRGRESMIPAHGAEGDGHAALAIPAEEMDEWRERLLEHGVEVEFEMDWPAGTHSIYFRDPDHNSLELIDGSHYQKLWEKIQASEK